VLFANCIDLFRIKADNLNSKWDVPREPAVISKEALVLVGQIFKFVMRAFHFVAGQYRALEKQFNSMSSQVEDRIPQKETLRLIANDHAFVKHFRTIKISVGKQAKLLRRFDVRKLP